MFKALSSLFGGEEEAGAEKPKSGLTTKRTGKGSTDSKKSEDDLDDSDSEDEIEDRPLYLNEFMGTLCGDDDLADCFFILGTGKDQIEFPAHRLVLAASSPIFEAMLYPPTFPGDKAGHGGQQEGEEPVTILLEDVRPEVFKALLSCVYSDRTEISPSIIRPLIDLGQKYQVEKVQQLCLEYLSTDINSENACELYELSSILSGNKFALKYILDEAEEVFESKGFLDLSKDRLMVLVRNDGLGIEEGALFKHVLRWGRHQLERGGKAPCSTEDLRTYLKDILPHIRFPTMQAADIAGEVAGSGLLSTDALLSLFQYLSVEEKGRDRVHSGFNSKPRTGGKCWDESKILGREVRSAIKKVLQDKKGVKLKLIYRGSRDGFNGSTFHRLCNNKGPTLTVVQTQDKKHIFGGYNGDSWRSSGSYSTPQAFIFSIQNSQNKVFKFTPTGSNHVYHNSSYGPTWGAGHDLHISNNMRSSSNYCNPSSYRTAAPGFPGTYTNSLFAGQRNFFVGEIEVFKMTTSAH